MKSWDVKAFSLAVVLLLFPALSSSLDWREEFEEICSMVVVGDQLKAEELEGLLERSKKLVPVIESSGDPAGKIYLMRLDKCRAFFEYALELKTDKKPDSE